MTKKYEHIDFRVPESVRRAARRGLELRRKQSPSNKAGLDPMQAAKEGIGSCVARARDLSAGKVSPETVRRMKAYFSRHASNFNLDAGKKPHEHKGYVAGLLWGGDAGRSWANKLVRQMDAADAKK